MFIPIDDLVDENNLKTKYNTRYLKLKREILKCIRTKISPQMRNG